ncbi:hypothetical protein A3A55_02470 [Candidatus Roizmanbacteria bacterium RIFCSPLOWO2_01_FULL_40_14]|uniref:Geranylgeranyl pyrophosphate synthase n=3 Tax=Candidatus Roizmaniibacteriota TaxID=1752723 RepID=A0A0G0XD84_9BACT|nr:MAG: Geranylgeranyl pyrophosphate synthase [Candidatus Levybacteria bacterium GW2011_GWA2_40_16]KKR72324.1 MAG: Geranylgeranyl pyrophosphate synthase [Candidatus Roizmanbacteria bacterium GW2011_GWB1_40_7]KKR93182.1 MAG: Geranylgeranyl pyrophosphate synthase [Candidatus Roizmanbacteria bacterium GW2011_GWA1_41_13]KKS22825.1 MAG: Geranylgeranyl pyrophosphate synthase [Candidatus Roizmanbacteria bacterium GW2011_GWC2_41_7]OGK49808.1 MAG: hypothetical protein A3A55_02470 [Candidatus Roizmanbact
MKKLFVTVQNHVDSQLSSFLESKKPSLLTSAIKDTIAFGGKRIRPTLLYVAYKGFGGKDDKLIWQIGAALELFHTSAIIHDDIIDNSKTRRGKPTVVEKHGLPTALLVGDLALSLANELFYNTLLTKFLSQQVSDQWYALQEEMMYGQFLDVSSNVFNLIKNNDFDKDRLEQKVMEVMEYKTARYSVERPLLLGAKLANASVKEHELLSHYGRKVGIVFQIQDDILGIFGDEKRTGKSANSDLEEGKLTLLMAKLLSVYSDRKELKTQVRNVEWVRDQLRKYRIDEECKKLASELIQEAKKSLSKTSLTKDSSRFLLSFAEYVLTRTA